MATSFHLEEYEWPRRNPTVKVDATLTFPGRQASFEDAGVLLTSITVYANAEDLWGRELSAEERQVWHAEHPEIDGDLRDRLRDECCRREERAYEARWER